MNTRSDVTSQDDLLAPAEITWMGGIGVPGRETLPAAAEKQDTGDLSVFSLSIAARVDPKLRSTVTETQRRYFAGLVYYRSMNSGLPRKPKRAKAAARRSNE